MKKYIIAFALLLSPISFAHASGILSLGTIIPNSTVSAGTTITFQATLAGSIVNAKYTLSDTFPGSTLSNSNISNTGSFNWTPSALDVGNHIITINSIDSSNIQSSVTQTIIVTLGSPLSIQSLSPGSNIFPAKPLSFSVGAPGFANPQFLLTDSFSGSSVSGANIDSFGNFTWTPRTSDVGVHSLGIQVSSAGRVDNVYQTVTVNGISIQNVYATNMPVGTPFTFTITPSGLNSPSYTVSDSLPNNTVSTNGTINYQTFSWTPQAQDVGTHIIKVTATDGDNVSVAQVSVTVTGTAPTNTNPTTPIITQTPTTPVSVSANTFVSYLTPGSSGTEVSALQKLLSQLKLFSGPINGSFGPQTEAAVIAFQKSRGLAQLGVVGPATRAALNKLLSYGTIPGEISNPVNDDGYVFNTSLSVGSTGTAVKELQMRLAAHGFFEGPVNGNYGPLTKAAVIKYQAAHGIAQLGNVGPATRASLNRK